MQLNYFIKWIWFFNFFDDIWNINEIFCEGPITYMQFLRYSLLIIPLVIIIFFGFIILNENNAREFVPIEMTKFSSTTLDNKNIKNSDLPDTYFLNVWASWCITCKIEHHFAQFKE